MKYVFCALNSRKHACSIYCIVGWELNEAILWDVGTYWQWGDSNIVCLILDSCMWDLQVELRMC